MNREKVPRILRPRARRTETFPRDLMSSHARAHQPIGTPEIGRKVHRGEGEREREKKINGRRNLKLLLARDESGEFYDWRDGSPEANQLA